MEASPAAYPRGIWARGTPRTPARGGARRRVSTPPPPGSGGIARPARRLDDGLVSPEGASLWPRRAQPRARAVDARLTRHTAFDRAIFLPAEARPRRAGAAPPLRLPRPGEATGLRPPAAADGRRAQPSVAGAAAPRHGALHASP
jgi:hypothetical protein